MQACSESPQELQSNPAVRGLRDAAFVPQRVIENDEHLIERRERRQQLAQPGFVRVLPVTVHLRPERACPAGGQVVYSQVEERRSEWNRPFHRYGRAAAFVQHLQRDRRIDVVVIGDGNQRVLIECLNLRFLQQPGVVGAQRRSPPAPCQVEPRAMDLLIDSFAVANGGCENGSARGRVVDEIQTLARVQGVAV